MTEYVPDRWCVIRIPNNRETVYKVFASWSGGYIGGDSWKLNSGIVRADLIDGCWHFQGSSGSVYVCGCNSYGTNGYGAGVLDSIIARAADQGHEITVMPSHTDWASLDYDPLQQWIKQGLE